MLNNNKLKPRRLSRNIYGIAPKPQTALNTTVFSFNQQGVIRILGDRHRDGTL